MLMQIAILNRVPGSFHLPGSERAWCILTMKLTVAVFLYHHGFLLKMIFPDIDWFICVKVNVSIC
jgi:hypothetical protein